MNRHTISSLQKADDAATAVTRRLEAPAARTVVLVAASVLLGVLLDRVFVTGPVAPPQRADETAVPSAPLHEVRRQVQRRREAVSRGRGASVRGEATTSGARSAVDDGDDDGVQSFRARQAGELLGLVKIRLRAAEMSISGRTTEGAVNQLQLYQMGLIDGVIRTAPELVGALSDQIERTLCEPKAKAATQVSLLRMIVQMPDLASAKGLECVLQEGRAEDLVLWSGLDALGASQLPKGALLERLARTAKDERTTQRLATLRGDRDVGPLRGRPAQSAVAHAMSEGPFETGAPLDEEEEP